MDRLKRIWYLSPMRAAFAARSYKQWVKRNLQTESQISGPSEWLGIRVKICHDGMLEDTNSLDGAQFIVKAQEIFWNADYIISTLMPKGLFCQIWAHMF